MKKTYILGFVLALFLSACSDILDKTPDGRTPLDAVFEDPELTAKYLSNCYNNIPKKELLVLFLGQYTY